MSDKYTLELNYNQMSIIYCALSEYEEKQSNIDTNRLKAKTVSEIKKEIETVKELKSEVLKITGRKETPKGKEIKKCCTTCCYFESGYNYEDEIVIEKCNFFNILLSLDGDSVCDKWTR